MGFLFLYVREETCLLYTSKTFTADYLTKRRVKNSGQQKQYYVKNHHEAIIPKTVYYKIQEEIARRSSLKKTGIRKGKTVQGVYSSKYALTGITVSYTHLPYAVPPNAVKPLCISRVMPCGSGSFRLNNFCNAFIGLRSIL